MRMNNYKFKKVGDYIHLHFTYKGVLLRQTTGIKAKGLKVINNLTGNKDVDAQILTVSNFLNDAIINDWPPQRLELSLSKFTEQFRNVKAEQGSILDYIDKYIQLLEDPHVDILDKPKGSSASTIKQFKAMRSLWAECHDGSLDRDDYSILTAAEPDAAKRILRLNRKIKEFVRLMDSKGKTVGTIRNYLSKLDRIFSWVKSNYYVVLEYGDVNLPTPDVNKFAMTDELFKFLLKMKADDAVEERKLLALQVQMMTSLRWSDLSRLKLWEHVKDNDDVYYVSIETQKTKEKVITPIPFELVKQWSHSDFVLQLDSLLEGVSYEEYTQFIRDQVKKHPHGHRTMKKVKTFLMDKQVAEIPIWEGITSHDIRKASISFYGDYGLDARLISGHKAGSKVFEEVYSKPDAFKKLRPFVAMQEELFDE